MKNQKLLKVLKDLGLNDKESEIYLAALTLGPTTVLKLATHSGVKRTSIYSTLESLKLKGLLSTEVRGFKARYVATPPASLKTLLSNRLQLLESCLPDFEALYNLAGVGSVIRQYQGLRAIQGLYEELLGSLKAHEDYMVMTDLAKWESLDLHFFRSFVKRRSKKSIRLRILTTPSKSALRRQNEDRDYDGALRILPTGTQLGTNLIITDSYVVFHQLVAPMDAILLNNKSVIALQKELFNVIWNQSSA